MKLYERFGDSGFHTCIVSTFGIGFDAYENIALPRLRGARCFNNILIADGRMLSYSLDGASVLPDHAGRHYTVAGVQVNGGVFHPKITLQLGRQSGRAIIASANMTASGLAGNLELAGEIACTADGNGEAQLVAAVWQYLTSTCDADDQALAHQLQWLRPRTPWLFDRAPAADTVTLGDGSAAAFLTGGVSDVSDGIGTRFANLFDERPVERLIVMSPYWDDDLAALQALATRLGARRVLILVDVATALFPATAAGNVPGIQIFDLGEFGKNRFIHAKAIIAETAEADHLLYGSANCTAAALGTINYAGANQEACLYRRLPPGTVLKDMGLDSVIDGSTPLAASALPAYRKEKLISLAEAGQRAPGRFECVFDTLLWHPPAAGSADGSIELLGAGGADMNVQLTPLGPGKAEIRHYRMSNSSERPVFGRLRFADGTASAPAIVSLVDALREIVREARGKKAESAALQLAEETEEGLWLCEVLTELEAAERAEEQKPSPGIKRARAANEAADEGQHRTLSYEQFIAGRRLRSDRESGTRNSLAGSDLSLVRNFLNRILAIGGTATEMPPDDGVLAKGLDLGDETADAAAAMELGEEFAPVPASPVAVEQDEVVERQRAARVHSSRAQISGAVAKFNTRLKDRAESGQVNSFDVLRLRAMLMIIAAAGQPREPSAKTTTLQVLPLSNEADGWPRLLGKLLFAFFGGNRPVVHCLTIEAVHDKLPDDIFECWVTALWAIQACVCAAKTHPDMRTKLLPALSRLALQLYTHTGLRPEELSSYEAGAVLTQLSTRFAGRLGLDPRALHLVHTETVERLIKN